MTSQWAVSRGFKRYYFSHLDSPGATSYCWEKADEVYLKKSLRFALQSSFLSSTLKLYSPMFLETFRLALLLIEENRGAKRNWKKAILRGEKKGKRENDCEKKSETQH